MSLNKIKNFLFKEEAPIIDEPHIISEAKPEDRKLYEEFIKEYDSGNLEFNDTPYRKGAVNTCDFGLSDGFKYIDGEMIWGYVRLHSGVDRARGGTVETKYDGTVEDVVQVPFDFNRSAFYEYGDKSYGTLAILFNDKYGFEMRIAHMNPNQNERKGNEKGPIIKWYYERAKKKKSFEKNWTMGSAGTWGASSGAHTHTEFKSLDETCEVFDILLKEKFGEESLKEYTSEEVLALYRKQKNYTNASEETILKDYQELRKTKKVLFLNKFKCQYVDWDDSIKTRYSSYLLFNGL